ncbi:MAG TPA: phosphotransferase [Pyrinomonadaceae bacterium]|jgi:Ser/Thr protein kinase RdoA (MazF antagonist)|nr:phosphotransferase [Pyrinomonadaceae bacterium]
MTTVVQKAPRLAIDDAIRIAAEVYGLKVSASVLPSERDQNFLLEISTREKFVLKIANSDEDSQFLDCQNQLIRFLAAANIDLEFPRIVKTIAGEDLASVTGDDSRKHSMRLLTWIDGACFAEVKPHDRKLLASLGKALGQMDTACANFVHPAARRVFHWDLRNAQQR